MEYWFSSEHKINEELINYIQKLRRQGIKSFLATNNEKHRINYMIKRMGFSESLDKVYASAHLGHKKPAIEFYSKMMDDLGDIKRDEVLFWDDDEENIEGAKKFGIHAEFYTTFENFEKKMTTYLNKTS